MTYFSDGNLPTVAESLMRQRISSRRRTHRRGASAVELALLLPLLGLFFLVTVDFARLYYHYTIITNCARNGALYGSNPTAAAESPYLTLQAAAQADAQNNDLNPLPAVTSTNGTDSSGNPYIEVTVSYDFATISNYPGLANPINLSRTVRMRIVPATPN
jgi:Flp pilus assembly protein TadG